MAWCWTCCGPDAALLATSGVEAQPEAECLKDYPMDVARHGPFERVVAHHLLDTAPPPTSSPVPDAEELVKEVHVVAPAPEVLGRVITPVAPARSARGGRGEYAQSGASRFGIVVDQLGCKDPPKHGLNFDVTDGTALLIDSIGEGLVREWNKSRPNLQVCPGDRIVEASGVYGDAVRLRNRLNEALSLTLIILRPRWFTVKLSKAKENQDLGLEMGCVAGCATILVKKVTAGIVMDWNRDHQEFEVSAGDRIAEVNGTHGDASLLRDALLKKDNLELRILVAPDVFPVGCYSRQC